MKMKLIPAGEFLMGSRDGDGQALDNEKPQDRVRITRPFYLGTTEVTRGQFRRFVDEAGVVRSGSGDAIRNSDSLVVLAG
jgi:formylglycine-generating enzyme required for sulfatase activity